MILISIPEKSIEEIVTRDCCSSSIPIVLDFILDDYSTLSSFMFDVLNGNHTKYGKIRSDEHELEYSDGNLKLIEKSQKKLDSDSIDSTVIFSDVYGILCDYKDHTSLNTDMYDYLYISAEQYISKHKLDMHPEDILDLIETGISRLDNAILSVILKRIGDSDSIYMSVTLKKSGLLIVT